MRWESIRTFAESTPARTSLTSPLPAAPGTPRAPFPPPRRHRGRSWSAAQGLWRLLLLAAVIYEPSAGLIAPRGRRPSAVARRSASPAGMDAAGAPLVTAEEVLEMAEKHWRVYISESRLGPAYRVVARSLDAQNEAGERGEGRGKIVGFTTGFVTGSLLRQDTMQVYGVNRGYGRDALATAPQGAEDWEDDASRRERSFQEGEWAAASDEEARGGAAERRRADARGRRRSWRSQSVHGLTLLIGYYAMRLAYDEGCRRAELLAINDDDRQHMLLVRFYRRLGFRELRPVTEDLRSVPDRLVWGGIGTLMEGDVTDILERNSRELRRAIASLET